ncbi:MAG: ATP-binding cassette domain-containing protein [Ruminococcaceae bacterium]|nr:ATP-binding cassette domain-containing protein [Oscillospiraceae bacterium]
MALEIKNVTKKYDRTVLDGVTHTFEYGKLYVIKGVSGCGKTTLLNIMGGLDSDYEGEIFINGENGKAVLTEKVGYVFQQSLLISDLTVKDNLLLINDDIQKADEITERLGVRELYDKYPSQLSGGERQRIAVARTLITGVKIILADEPTASLDGTNSALTAQLLAELCGEGCAVIVATHEHYFDTIADEIIHLDYGKIGKTESFDLRKAVVPEKCDEKAQKKNSRAPVKIVYARGKRQWKIWQFVPAALIAVLIMLVSTLTNQTEEILTGYYKHIFPPDVFNTTEREIALMNDELYNSLTLYYPYTLKEDGVKALYYAEKEDSVLATAGMLKYGHFPESKDEVIVSYEYAESKFGAVFDENIIVGRKITFAGREFTVAGCLNSFDDDASIGFLKSSESVFDSDAHYYRNRGEMIFIDYSVISEIGKLSFNDSGTILASLDGLMQNDEVRQQLLDIHIKLNKEDGRHHSNPAATFSLNKITREVDSIRFSLNIVVAALYIILVLCFMIACIFIRSKVSVELYYRSREIGFLQIFKIGRKRLKKMLLWEYLVRLGISVCVSLVIYTVLSAAASLYLGEFIWFNVLHVAVVFAVLLLLYVHSLLRCIKTHLKKDIISLIS